MKRYRIFSNYSSYGQPGKKSYDVEEHPRGEYVRYEDIKDLAKHIRRLQALVEKQAKDCGLWYQPRTASEDYIQRALRSIHGAIENEDMSWLRKVTA